MFDLRRRRKLKLSAKPSRDHRRLLAEPPRNRIQMVVLRFGAYLFFHLGYSDPEPPRGADVEGPHSFRYRGLLIRSFDNSKMLTAIVDALLFRGCWLLFPIRPHIDAFAAALGTFHSWDKARHRRVSPVARYVEQCFVLAAETRNEQPLHPQLPHSAERHRRTGFVFWRSHLALRSRNRRRNALGEHPPSYDKETICVGPLPLCTLDLTELARAFIAVANAHMDQRIDWPLNGGW
jgi:hypothetical protein